MNAVRTQRFWTQTRAEALVELARAQAELIICYQVRAGRRDTERALDRVSRARARLRGMGVEIP